MYISSSILYKSTEKFTKRYTNIRKMFKTLPILHCYMTQICLEKHLMTFFVWNEQDTRLFLHCNYNFIPDDDSTEKCQNWFDIWKLQKKRRRRRRSNGWIQISKRRFYFNYFLIVFQGNNLNFLGNFWFYVKIRDLKVVKMWIHPIICHYTI